MVVFRENTEDVYAGFEVKEGTEKAKKLLKFFKSNFIFFSAEIDKS